MHGIVTQHMFAHLGRYTQGLIEAGKSGNTKAFRMVRRLYDWFNDPNKNTAQPYLYDGVGNGEQGHIASTRVYLETPGSKWADVQVAQDVFRDDLWLRQLANRNTSAITWYHMPRPNHPHCYLITSFLAFFDQCLLRRIRTQDRNPVYDCAPQNPIPVTCVL
jgi:hypothetical protein